MIGIEVREEDRGTSDDLIGCHVLDVGNKIGKSDHWSTEGWCGAKDSSCFVIFRHFSMEEFSFPIEESLKSLRFLLKNLHFHTKTRQQTTFSNIIINNNNVINNIIEYHKFIFIHCFDKPARSGTI